MTTARLRPSLFVASMLIALPGVTSAMSVTLRPSVESPAPVGSRVTWETTLNDADPSGGEVWYRYRVRTPQSAAFRTIRDFSPVTTFEWVPIDAEGTYQMEVTARNRQTGDVVTSSATWKAVSPATGDSAVLTPSRHELVYLYSAPRCAAESRFRVLFEPVDPGAGVRQFTPWYACDGTHTENAWVAGLTANTEYRVWHQIATADGSPADSPALALTTGDLLLSPALTRVLQKPDAVLRQGVLLQSAVFQHSVATDASGRIIWYYEDEARYLTRPEPGGYFMALIEKEGAPDSEQILREIGLAGNVIFETNAGRINEQLDALGKHHITSFHHEARRLPDGKILVLAGTERIIDDVQGPGPVDVIGDTILVLNRNLQVEWVWDSFEHLDVSRKAILGETCVHGGGGCPQFRLADTANDWLHGNALQLTSDGHILYSARHQDWVIKIDYANGEGSGGVLWRLGKDGDFQMSANDPFPWFSHQHDPNFERGAAGAGRMLVFDNGNTRYEEDPSAHSRGQVLQIDEIARTASLALSIDLGSYSMALGSAQKLNSGNYHFDVGWMPNGFSQALEYNPAGQLVTGFETETQQYRSFRMRDLYTP